MTTLDVLAARAWVQQASCRGDDVDRWHPGTGQIRLISELIAICNACPVRAECLEDAMRAEAGSSDRCGIRGGLCAEARKRLARRG